LYEHLEDSDKGSVSAIALKKGEKLVIQTDNQVKDLPYLKVGNGKTGRYGESMNLIQEMARMTKPEQVMFALLEKGLDYWDERSINKVKLNMDELSSTEKQYIKRAYPLLEAKGIIIRLSRGTYQINPRLILAKDSTLAILEWDKKCNPKFKIQKESK
jgi:hypothetical protein